jgi:tRNA A-37 threonylcarbamoyl transferase component Bud32
MEGLLVMSSDLPVVDDGVYRRTAGPPLGSGGFGTTYLATDAAGRRVVVKELHAELDAQFQGRFAGEARMLTKFKHDAIVQVFQFGRWRRSGRLFYSMDYVEGASLATQIGKRDLADQLESVVALAEVAGAIAYTHEQRVVHRDLKPDNVLVRGDGSAVVIDWGLSGVAGGRDGVDARRSLHPAKGALTREGVGSAFYMSPEQASCKALSPTMDVYALGAMLYETLCGHPPFKDVIGENPSNTEARAHPISTAPTPLEGRFEPRVAPLAELAMHCLERDPRRRPRIRDVSEALAVWSQSCGCRRCGRIVLRASATRVEGRWICSGCGMLSAASVVYRGSAADVAEMYSAGQPSAAAARQVDTGARASAAAESTTTLTRRAILEDRGGVRSTLATDELGRSVVIEELRADADEALQRSFQRAIDVMSAADTIALPRILRSSSTMFVHEHVAGTSLEAWAGQVDDLMLVGLRALCELVLTTHASGIAHGGIRPDSLIVHRSEGRCALVAIDWRGLMTPAADGAPDTAAVLDVARRLAISSAALGWLAHASGVAEQNTTTGDAALHRVMRSVERYVERVTCYGCGGQLRLGTAVMVGNGYVCEACPGLREAFESGVIEEIDLHLTPRDQRDLMALHRAVHFGRLTFLFLTRLALGLAFGVLPLLLPDRYVLYGAYSALNDFVAVIVQPALLALYFGVVYHRSRATYYRNRLRLSPTAGEHVVSALVAVGVSIQLLSLLAVTRPWADLGHGISFVAIATAFAACYHGYRGTWRDAITDWVRVSREARGDRD